MERGEANREKPQKEMVQRTDALRSRSLLTFPRLTPYL